MKDLPQGFIAILCMSCLQLEQLQTEQQTLQDKVTAQTEELKDLGQQLAEAHSTNNMLQQQCQVKQTL